MSELRDIIREHGGSFDGAPNRASFFMPVEIGGNAAKWEAFKAAMSSAGRKFDFVRTEKNGWELYRFVGERGRKAFKTVFVTDRNAPNNINPNLKLEIYPDGRIVLYEGRRRAGFETTAGAVYLRCVLNECLRKGAAKAREAKARKKDRQRKRAKR